MPGNWLSSCLKEEKKLNIFNCFIFFQGVVPWDCTSSELAKGLLLSAFSPISNAPTFFCLRLWCSATLTLENSTRWAMPGAHSKAGTTLSPSMRPAHHSLPGSALAKKVQVEISSHLYLMSFGRDFNFLLLYFHGIKETLSLSLWPSFLCILF